MGISAFLAESLGNLVLGVLLPCVNGRLVREVRDRNFEPSDVADAFSAQTPGLLERQLKHRLRHGFVAAISLGPLRRETPCAIGGGTAYDRGGAATRSRGPSGRS